MRPSLEYHATTTKETHFFEAVTKWPDTGFKLKRVCLLTDQPGVRLKRIQRQQLHAGSRSGIITLLQITTSDINREPFAQLSHSVFKRDLVC